MCCDKNIQKEENEISKLQKLLLVEKVKNDIYRQIIENNTKIQLGDIIVEKEGQLDIYNTEKLDFTITVHKHCSAIKVSNETQPKKKIKYSTVKKVMKLKEEKDIKNKQLENIDVLEDDTDVVTEELAKSEFDECFTHLETKRTYNKYISELRSLRINNIKNMTLTEYLELLNEHISRLKTIFEKKKFTESKIKNIIKNSISGLDMRLLFYKEYWKSHLEIDEHQDFKECLDKSIIYPKKFEPFNIQHWANNFLTYGLVLFTIKENIVRYTFNKFDFFNVIYLPLPNSTDKDPFSFYTLEKVDNKGNRCWKMDCRLENLSNDFRMVIKDYLIVTFRRIYHDIFHDNEYRPDFKKKHYIMEFDCEQLLQNIFTVDNPINICNLFRMLVKEKGTYIPTEKDKFNIRSNDTLQERRFKALTHENTDVVKELFDNMSTEVAVDFYREYEYMLK